MSAVRAVLGLAILLGWMLLVPSRAAFGRRETWIALGLGVLFAGNVFLVFKAIETVEVPIAILTYFVYPLLTGLAAAASGLERVTWRGAAAAIAAFLGLALMIGAHPTTLAATGILAALGDSRLSFSSSLSRHGNDKLEEVGWQSPGRMVCTLGYYLPVVAKEARWDLVELRSDMCVTLQLLLKGYPNAIWQTTVVNQKRDAPGGCNTWRTDEMSDAEARKLVDLFPRYVSVGKRKYGRLEVTVQWQKALRDGQ